MTEQTTAEVLYRAAQSRWFAVFHPDPPNEGGIYELPVSSFEDGVPWVPTGCGDLEQRASHRAGFIGLRRRDEDFVSLYASEWARQADLRSDGGKQYRKLHYSLNSDGNRLGKAVGVPEFDLVFDRLQQLIEAALDGYGWEGFKFAASWDSACWRDQTPMLDPGTGGSFPISEDALALIECLQWFIQGQRRLGISHFPEDADAATIGRIVALTADARPWEEDEQDG